MVLQTQNVFFAFAAVVLFGLRWCFTKADMPKIKNIPEVPGVPLFGNLLQLGDSHTQKAAKWAREYEPVFQVRLGNRVGFNVLNIYD